MNINMILIFKKNLLYFKVKGLSKLENSDDSISNISYTIDLSKIVWKIEENKFTSYLHFPD